MSNKMPLTDRQNDVYEAFKEFIKTHDYSPTVKELREILQSKKSWKGKTAGAVQACLRGMALKGWVKDLNKSRKSRNLIIN